MEIFLHYPFMNRGVMFKLGYNVTYSWFLDGLNNLCCRKMLSRVFLNKHAYTHRHLFALIVCVTVNPHKTKILQVYYMDMKCGQLLCRFWSRVPLQKHMATSSDSPNILWNSKVHICIFESLPLVPVLSQMNPFHNLYNVSVRSILIFPCLDL
jgi:hypothetical protein